MLARMTTTQTKWFERVQQWQQSGVGAEQFAQGKGYRPSTLVWYRTRLRRLGLLDDGTRKSGRDTGARRNRDSAIKSRLDDTRRVRPEGVKGAARGAEIGNPMPIAKVIRRASADSHASAVVIEVGLVRINVRSDFDATLLQKVVRVLGGAT